MYLNISETGKSFCLKLKICMKCHNYDMQVKFHNSVLHFDKVMSLFKSSNLHNQILDDMLCPLYKSFTNGRIFFKLHSNVYLNKVMCRTHLTLVPAVKKIGEGMNRIQRLF